MSSEFNEVMIRLQPDTESKIIELAKSGNRPKAIALETGVPEHYVRKFVNGHGIKIIAKKSKTNLDLYKIIAELINGVNLTDIAKNHSVTRQYIFLIKENCKKAGISINSRERGD